MSTRAYDRVRATVMAAGGKPVALRLESPSVTQRLEAQGAIRRAGQSDVGAVLWVWGEEWAPELVAAVRRAAASLTAQEIAGVAGMSTGSVLRLAPNCVPACSVPRDMGAYRLLVAELDAIIARAVEGLEVVDA